jgi:predicted lipid-binding transport protein (Tim44 family)
LSPHPPRLGVIRWFVAATGHRQNARFFVGQVALVAVPRSWLGSLGRLAAQLLTGRFFLPGHFLVVLGFLSLIALLGPAAIFAFAAAIAANRSSRHLISSGKLTPSGTSA